MNNFMVKYALSIVALFIAPLLSTRYPEHIAMAAPELVPLRDTLNQVYPESEYPSGSMGALSGTEHVAPPGTRPQAQTG